ncbi:DUF2867 domain-containing protein [Pseudarthrobacter sp. N5]|uniref:DUF2867 domain-containing protein n=1 Tax=Pseudarthrobacter sp. N5 TaxID=3418416 RepID=UPI003CF2388A
MTTPDCPVPSVLQPGLRLQSAADGGTAPAFRSLVFVSIPAPDYADVIVLPVPAGCPADPRLWAEAVFSARSAPAWIRLLMGLRQAVVGVIGIHRATTAAFAVAEVLGEEALINTDDTHLDFRCGVAFDAGARLLRVTTAVRLKGWRGRLYFAPVRVLHPLVVHAMMAGAIRRLSRSAA